MARILGERPFLLVPTTVKRVFFFPEGYRHRTKKTVEGVASTGEISPKGLVELEEDWDGRVSARVMPATLHLRREPDGHVRMKTAEELIEEGRFVVGLGPTGVGSLP